MKPSEITQQEYHEILETNKLKLFDKYEPFGLFYLQDKNKWIGIDNSDGNCWVEEFDTKEACLFWLELSISYPQCKFINNYFNKILPSKRVN